MQGLYRFQCSVAQVVSPVRFPSKRMENKALQTVSVGPIAGREQPFLFTFCLERIEQGPYKVHMNLMQPMQSLAILKNKNY